MSRTIEQQENETEEQSAAGIDLMIEIERLNKAVDSFASQMKVELRKRAEEGKRGWDQRSPSDVYIAMKMNHDSRDLRFALAGGTFDNVENSKECIDIANRAMILWARHNQITTVQVDKEKPNNG